jgi:DNA-directed RNA polymerase I, II, and III subunit RPABC2
MSVKPTTTLTKYEEVRALGTRAVQIGQNQRIYVDPGDEYDPIEVARMELEQGKLPIFIRRNMPNGGYVEVDAATNCVVDSVGSSENPLREFKRLAAEVNRN